MTFIVTIRIHDIEIDIYRNIYRNLGGGGGGGGGIYVKKNLLCWLSFSFSPNKHKDTDKHRAKTH